MMKNGNGKTLNADLWEKMLQLLDKHQVELRWVKGHNRDSDNERCDQLAKAAAHKPDLPDDEGYTNVGKSL